MAYLPFTVLQSYVPGRQFKITLHFDVISLNERADGIRVKKNIETRHIYILLWYTLCCLDHCE